MPHQIRCWGQRDDLLCGRTLVPLPAIVESILETPNPNPRNRGNFVIGQFATSLDKFY